MPQAPAAPGVDPNQVWNDPAGYTAAILAEAERRAEAKLRAEAGSVVAPLASMARSQARTYKPDIWEFYGPEIETTMAGFNESVRADVDNWRKVVDFVAGQHIDDLIARRMAEARQTVDHGTITSDGVVPIGDATSASPIRKLFKDNPEIERHYKDAGLSVSDVISHGKRMGHNDETEYAKMLSRKFAGAA